LKHPHFDVERPTKNGRKPGHRNVPSRQTQTLFVRISLREKRTTEKEKKKKVDRERVGEERRKNGRTRSPKRQET